MRIHWATNCSNRGRTRTTKWSANSARKFWTRYGNVDRSKLGQIIFADAQKRARLNQILHPRILDVVRKWFTAQGHPGGPELAVVEAALIIEAGYNKELDKVIVCWCPAGTAIAAAGGARTDSGRSETAHRGANAHGRKTPPGR